VANKTEKHTQESAYELVFKDIVGFPLQESRRLLQAAVAARQEVNLITRLHEEKLIVYEVQFEHDHNQISSYQVRLSAWAQDSLTHVQFFREPITTELQRRSYNLGVLVQRLVVPLVFWLLALFALYAGIYLLLILTLFPAICYTLNNFKDFKWERPKPFLAEDEAILMQILSELCEAEEMEEGLLLEDSQTQTHHS
jgi:hypothetical protein